MKRFLIFILSCGVMSSALAFGADKPDKINPYMQRAIDISDIFNCKMPPFRLSATLILHLDEKVPRQGKYLFLHNSDGKWREEIILPGFTRVRVGNGPVFWQTRSMEFDPLNILDVAQMVHFSLELDRSKKSSFSKPFTRKKEGYEYFCHTTKEDNHPPMTFCFDSSSGQPISIDSGQAGFQSRFWTSSISLKDFRKIADKWFPGTILGFGGAKLLAEFHLDDLVEEPDMKAEYFLPQPGSSRRLNCPIDTTLKLKLRVQADYPLGQRIAGHQGTVTLAALIGEDGKVSSVFPVESAGADFDAAAAKAVSQWIYDPPMCDGVVGPMETTIKIFFVR